MPEKIHTGPLVGIRILEFAAIGPAPFAGMLLADLGADVVRIDRADGEDYKAEDVEARGRESIVLDLKDSGDIAIAQALAAKAHILIEGMRPGVMERLGLGPDVLLAANPALVYGRITGWGQSGPLAGKAGHDINYLGLSGALHAMGPADKPAIPLNLIADFGGGALYLVMGILAALHHAQKTGTGQVVDAAMTDGVISLMNMIYGDFHAGTWLDRRESNVIDGSSPFYNVYRCADGKWLSLAAIEPRFYQSFVATAGIDAGVFAGQWRRDSWPEQRNTLEALFLQKSRAEWLDHFSAVDVCVAPVLSLAEAQAHPQNLARGSFQEIDGVRQASALPNLSKTPAATPFGVQQKNSNHHRILDRWNITE